MILRLRLQLMDLTARSGRRRKICLLLTIRYSGVWTARVLRPKMNTARAFRMRIRAGPAAVAAGIEVFEKKASYVT